MNNDTSVQGGNEPLSHLERIRHLQAHLSFLHEVVDRTGCISDQWHDHVQQHRAVLGNPELVALSAKMRGALLEFYRHACFLLNEADFKVSKAEADYVLAQKEGLK